MAQCAQNPERKCVCDARVQDLQRELDRAGLGQYGVTAEELLGEVMI